MEVFIGWVGPGEDCQGLANYRSPYLGQFGPKPQNSPRGPGIYKKIHAPFELICQPRASNIECSQREHLIMFCLDYGHFKSRLSCVKVEIYPVEVFGRVPVHSYSCICSYPKHPYEHICNWIHQGVEFLFIKETTLSTK